MPHTFHQPVLLHSVLEHLTGAEDVLDGTLGDGGHTAAFLAQNASVTAIDRDPDAIAIASERLAAFLESGRLRLFQSNFAELDNIAEIAAASFDGILLDLGVSSRQFDSDDRGFSFRPGASLDMRMGTDAITDASEVLNTSKERDLEDIFRDLADEPKARRLAHEIVRRREKQQFHTSDDLVNAVRAVLGPRSGPGDFARIFQGVRIAVNHEVDSLANALPKLRDRLKPSGRMVVISYHSGEDRLVKNAFRDWTRGCICPPKHPMCTCGIEPAGETLTRRAVVASDAEIQDNPRARSARLRAWEKKA